MKTADVEKIYEKFKELRKDDVKALQEWVLKQPHLPAVTELELVLFLHSCYYGMELAKTTIDNYFTYRTDFPEVFTNLNPHDKTVRKLMDKLVVVKISTTSEGYVVILCKLLNTDVKDFVYTEFAKIFDMVLMKLLLTEGPAEGVVSIFDLSEVKMGHVLKVSIFDLNKVLTYVQKAVPLRLKAVHIINNGSVMDLIVNMMKPFIKKELFDILYFHDASSTKMFEHVPKELFPSNYGGKSDSIEVLHENMIKSIIESAEFFKEYEKLVVDDSKRLGKPMNVSEVFGVEGSFKKLEID